MAHPIDILVGAHVRSFRRQQKTSQQTLGDAIGVRFQQIQKYETGTNRISASMLWKISNILKVNISDFFDGADELDWS